MSDKDSPFGDFGGNRTIIRPNPGGRRPAAPPGGAPPPMPPMPSAPAARPYSPDTAPAYGSPPPRPGDPYQARPTYPSAAPAAADSWISTPQRPVDTGAPMPRAEDLHFDELAAQNVNPIMRAAGPLLLLLGRLRVAMLRASVASLMEQVAEAINFFDRDIRKAGIATEQANTAKYLICATADDIVQNIPTEDRHIWTQYSMLSRFFGERLGGTRFFDELNRLMTNPTSNYDVLELQHACLALGFQGMHRSSSGGAGALQHIQREVYEALRRVRARVTTEFAPRWRGQDLAARVSRIRVPVWAAAAIVGLLLGGSFIALRAWLGARAETEAGQIIALNPSDPLTLARKAPAPPPKPVVTPTQVSQLQRVCGALQPEISAGSISCERVGDFIAIRVGNLILFDSGQATVLPQFKPIAGRIAQVVEKEAGPVKIIGHTDNVALNPTSAFKSNLQLSVERAKAVAALVTSQLSQPDRVSVDGKGPDQPIAPNTTVDGRAKNRRVEVLITRAD